MASSFDEEVLLEESSLTRFFYQTLRQREQAEFTKETKVEELTVNITIFSSNKIESLSREILFIHTYEYRHVQLHFRLDKMQVEHAIHNTLMRKSKHIDNTSRRESSGNL